MNFIIVGSLRGDGHEVHTAQIQYGHNFHLNYNYNYNYNYYYLFTHSALYARLGVYAAVTEPGHEVHVTLLRN